MVVKVGLKIFSNDKGGGLMACAKHPLILVSLGVLFLPAVVLGQAQVPKIQIHTGVDHQTLLNSNLQDLEKDEQGVVDYPLMLSGGQSNDVLAPVDLEFITLHAPWLDLSTLDKKRGDLSADPIIVLGADTDSKYEKFTALLGEIPPEAMLGEGESVRVNTTGEKVPQVCLRVSSKDVTAGDSVTVWATINPKQQVDTEILIFFDPQLNGFFDSGILDVPDKGTKLITIPAGAKESVPFKFKTSWSYFDKKVRKGALLAMPVLEHEYEHSSCLCPVLSIYRPPKITLSASPNPVDEGQSVTITATITRAKSSDVAVPLRYPNAQTTDTAVDPDDYTSLTSITIPANETEGSGEIPTHEDVDQNDEIFTVAIDGDQRPPDVEIGSPSSVKVTINDNDAPRVRFTSSTNSVGEDSGMHHVKVAINPAPGAGIMLTYTMGGTATKNVDYTSSGTVPVAAGATSVEIPVVITDDNVDEADETVILTLIGSTEYNLGTPKEHTLTITDNDLVGVSFASSTGRVHEYGGTYNVEVAISPAPESDITVNYRLTGTATSGMDYTSSWRVSVAAGTTSADIPIGIIVDDLVEGDETVILTLVDGTGYTVESPRKYTLTIIDVPVVRFDSSTGSVDEDGGTHHVAVSISPAPRSDITLNYNTLGGSATAGTDYTSSGTVFVPANATSAKIPVVIIDDNLDEDAETVILTLENGTGYNLWTPKKHTLTITDNDVVAVSFASSTGRVHEYDGTYDVEVAISPAPESDITVNYTLDGTATRGTDYTSSGTVSVAAGATSADIPIVIIFDDLAEGDETVILTLTDGTGYTVGSPRKYTLTIIDVPVVRFYSSIGNVGEDGGTQNVRVNVRPVSTTPFTLNYGMGGTATKGTDYTSSGAVSVPANASSVEIPVKIINDNVADDGETVILTLESGTGYGIRNPSTFTLTIREDATPTVSFYWDKYSVRESKGKLDVKVLIDPPFVAPLDLIYSTGGTATEFKDYRIENSGTFSAPANRGEVFIPIKINDDSVIESDETVILMLENVIGYKVGSQSRYTMTIKDNDTPSTPVASFSSATSSVNEDGGTDHVEVAINPAPGADLTLTYTLSGTATEDADYASSGTVSVTTGSQKVEIPVEITDDTLDEDAETVILTLTGGTGYTVGSPNVHTLTITDNDTPEVSFASATGSVGEDGGTHNVAVAFNPAPGSDFTLTYTLGGTAAEDADYSSSGTVSVTAGSQKAKIPVVITDDNADENNETVILTLTSGTGYTVGKPSEHTLIITDNDAPAVRFASATSNINEDAGKHEVTVNISPVAATSFTLNYGTGGTATKGTDYTSSGTISVAANVTSVKIPVVITDDNADENNETVILTLTSGTGYTVGNPSEHTLMITDNDAPTVRFASATSNLNEDAGKHEVTVNISPAAATSFTLNYGTSGTATKGTDYTSSGTIFVATNATSVKIPVVITDDNVDENNETVTLTLEDGTGYKVGNPSEHTLTINDNDSAALVANPASLTLTEGGSGSYTVRLTTQPSATVTVAITGDSGTDLTLNKTSLTFNPSGLNLWSTAQTVTLSAGHDDDFANDTQTLTLTAKGGGYDNVRTTITVTITDDDNPPVTSVRVSLSASPNPVEEGNSVTITATLTNILPDAVTVELTDTPGEPPTEPGDYSPLERITIPGGVLTGSGTIEVRDDGVSEGEERFTVAIEALPSGVAPGSPSSVEITIEDDDPPPPVEVTLSASPNPVDEGKSVTITARLTGMLETDVVVPLVYNDGTTHPPESGDYSPLRGVTIRSGETEGAGQIQTFTDADMDDEIFIAALGDLPPALLVAGRESSQFVTIRDITSPTEVTVVLFASPNSVDEGDDVTVTTTLSEALDTDVTIPLILTDGTADDEDYEAPIPVQVEIEAGKTSGTYPISTVQDDVAEGDETFTVALGTLPFGLVKGDRRLVELTITDDDEAGIEAPQSVPVAEGGETSFGISLTSEPLGEVEVMITWPSGTDLTVSPITRTFGPDNWRTEQQVSLRAANDMDLMDDQVKVTLTASGSIDYTGISETVSVTITDNDTPGIVAPASVTMAEGSQRALRIALAQMPSGPVTVTFGGHAGTDLALDKPFLMFTASDWDTPKTVTLTAAEDDDFVDDTETLTLTASGGGYAGVTTDITVTITDNDAAGLVAPEAVQMEEGGTHPLLIRLSASPPGPVTLTFTGHAGTDLILNQTSLTFTSADWNTSKTVTLTAAEDDEDYADETVGLKVTASGGDYDGATADITVTIMDNDERPGPLTITLYDEQALEQAAAIQLPIELSRPVDQVVTVQYTSTAGTAEAGLDYVTSRGIVIFDPGATRGVIEIEVIDDELPEENETFMVTLSKPRNAIIARETGTGTILDDDGASAILRVEDALVMEEEGMVRFRVLLSHPQRQMISAAYRTRDGTAKAGEDYEASSGVVTLAPGTVEALIAVPLLKDGLDWHEETFTVHLESSKHAEIAKAVGVATIQESTTVSEEVLEAYAARFVRTSSVQVVEALGERFRSGADGAACGAADRAEMARLWYSASSWDPSLGELLAGCRMSATSYSGSFSVWGRGAFRQFNGRDDDALTLRGEVTTGMLGADYRWRGGWLAGLLLAHSQGEGSFEVVQQSGEITAGLTGVYPYVSYARAGWDVWLSAGAGRGQAEVLELKGELVSRFGAMGVRGKLVSSGTIGLNYHGDVLVTDAEIKEHEVTAEVYRVRAGVEANVKIGDGLRPFVEANVRSDGGSAETGVGLEFGGGIRVAYPAWRLQADLRTQGLVMHTADGFTEWGISGSVQVGRQSEGLMMRVRPSWGRGQGMSMYGQQTILDAVPLGAGAQRTELELGYGVPWKDGTARSIVGMTQLSQGMMYRLGGELHPSERLTFSIFGLAHGRATSLEDLGVNVRGSIQY